MSACRRRGPPSGSATTHYNDKLRHTWLGRQLVARLGVKPEELPTVVAGIGGTPLPRPERMYFRFLPPVRPEAFRGLPLESAAHALRAHVEREVQQAINGLLDYRARDDRRALR